MDVEVIRRKVSEGKYAISFTHTEKLRQRRIKAEDVERAVETGSIIEAYADDPRGPSCLMLGFVGRRPLHVVCGCLDAEEILIITAYEPNEAEWADDWKTRKVR